MTKIRKYKEPTLIDYLLILLLVVFVALIMVYVIERDAFGYKHNQELHTNMSKAICKQYNYSYIDWNEVKVRFEV